MKEDLLQYIWQFQYYNHSQLLGTSGERLLVLHPGQHNEHQGPDFLEAKVKINETVWAGSIELHIHSSDWNVHGHSSDANYHNVILHVVWRHDKDIWDGAGNAIPTLELQNRVSSVLLHRYRKLMDRPVFIACESAIHQLNELVLVNWKERMVASRLAQRTQRIFAMLEKTKYHWEEIFWRLLAANFGLKVNGDFFEKIAESIPVSLLAKHKHNLPQLEALLFGQAGLLNADFEDKYPTMLAKEYRFLKTKYKLIPPIGSLYFLRMRPANFPTVRLAQLAVLVHQSEHLFSKLRETDEVAIVKKWLSVTANDYWHYHYMPDEESLFKVKTLGKQMVENILINTVVPLLYAYGTYSQDHDAKEKAIRWLNEIPAEKNSITNGFVHLGLENKSAFDSQAFIQLKNEYCDNHRCLQCAIGNVLLKKDLGVYQDSH